MLNTQVTKKGKQRWRCRELTSLVQTLPDSEDKRKLLISSYAHASVEEQVWTEKKREEVWLAYERLKSIYSRDPEHYQTFLSIDELLSSFLPLI